MLNFLNEQNDPKIWLNSNRLKSMVMEQGYLLSVADLLSYTLVMHESVARSQLPSRLYTKSGVELESFILRNKVYSQSRNCTPDDNVMCLLNAATDLLYVVL